MARQWLHPEESSNVFKRILVVCVGNVCRSPTAEYLLRHHLSAGGASIESAGLGALVDKPMDATALQVLGEHGVDGSAHRARQLTSGMLRDADLVLAMEREHVNRMSRMAPEASGKIMLLDRWVQGRDVADPYRQSREAFEHVYDVIAEAVGTWLPYLSSQRC